ncbi:unnamed protein product [Durusdinium trenchii]|uniref:Glycerophosphocholine acyltransferase 1 n=1 Tax=Durusdinium trenchii TaxID=1381693 RepID=A0ABP0MWT7_9DINO
MLLGGHLSFSVYIVVLLYWRGDAWDWRATFVSFFVFEVLFAICFGLIFHVLRAYCRAVETLQQQLCWFTLDSAYSSCCETDHPSGLCDRDVILQCISFWFGSTRRFEDYVRSDVRLLLTKQLANEAVSYRRVLQFTTPVLWWFVDMAGLHTLNHRIWVVVWTLFCLGLSLE